MRRLISATSYFAAGVGAAVLMAIGLGTAIGAAMAATHEESITAEDGVYTVPDRSVVCRVYGSGIGCTNGRVTIECDGHRCVPYHLDTRAEGDLLVVPNDANGPGVRVLRPGTSLNFRDMSCFADHTFFDCRLVDHLGGFQMNGLFARSSDFDDAPSGWPWDGRRYTAKYLLPGI